MIAETDQHWDKVFGATAHDPSCWTAHPMVARVRINVEGENGYVQLKLHRDRATGPAVCRAVAVSLQETRAEPDLYFWGEGECPTRLFEHLPNAREVRIFIEGPIEGDERICWSVGVWLAREN